MQQSIAATRLFVAGCCYCNVFTSFAAFVTLTLAVTQNIKGFYIYILGNSKTFTWNHNRLLYKKKKKFFFFMCQLTAGTVSSTHQFCLLFFFTSTAEVFVCVDLLIIIKFLYCRGRTHEGVVVSSLLNRVRKGRSAQKATWPPWPPWRAWPQAPKTAHFTLYPIGAVCSVHYLVAL